MRRNPSLLDSKLAKAAIAIAVCIAVAFVLPQPVVGVARGVLHTIAWPFQTAVSWVATQARDAADLVGSIGELKRGNDRLIEENVRLRAENAALAVLRRENEDLRASFGLRVRESFELVSAEIISYGGEGEQGAMIIDRGSVSGVRPGMAVVYGEGTIIGVVDEAYPASARVMLLSHSGSAIGGMTSERGAKGIVRGERGLGMVLDMVLERDGLETGDRVVTSGTVNAVPPGLFVGTVESVRDSEDRLFRQAVVVSPVDSGTTRFVSVIIEIPTP